MAKLHNKMFIAQATLEAWLESQKVDFDGSKVTLTAFRRSYDLEPAVRFLSIVGGSGDSMLLGKVLSERQILDLEGELLGESVVFGQIAFEVRAGYIATRRRSRARSPSELAADLTAEGG
jgi:hypothetical protein